MFRRCSRYVLSRRVATLALVAVGLLIVSIGVAGVGVAEESNSPAAIGVDGDELIVTVDPAALDNETDVIVEVTPDSAENDATERELSPDDDESDPYRYAESIDEFLDTDVPHENATVDVRSGNESLATETMDLRYAVLGGDATYHDRQFALVLDDRGGLKDGTEIDLRTDDNSTLSGTFDEDRGLIVERTEAFQDAVEESDELRIHGDEGATETVSVGEEAVVTPRDHRSLTTHPNGTVSIESPTLFANETYTVSVTTVSPDGTYVTEATAGDAVVSVKNPALLTAEELNVTVLRAGTDVVSDSGPVEFDTRLARITENGTGIEVDTRLDGQGEIKQLYVNGHDLRTFANVPYDDGEIDLTSVGVTLDENGTYDVIAVLDDGAVQASVDGAEPGAIDSVEDSETADDRRTLGGVSVHPAIAEFWWVLIGVVAAIAVGYVGGRRLTGGEPADGSSGLGSIKRAITRDPKVTIGLIDEETGEPIESRFKVTFRRDGETHATATTETGTVTQRLPSGRWTVIASNEDESEEETVVVESSQRIDLTFAANRARSRVIDDETGHAVPRATVRYDSDVGESGTIQTDSNGEFELELSRNVDDVSITIDHDRYETRTWTTPQNTFALTPLTGDLTVTVTIDGTRATDIEVEATPDDEFTRSRVRARTATTDRRGNARFDRLPVGEYRIRTQFDTDVVQPVSRSVQITEGTNGPVDLRVPFEFSLGDRRQRIERLRDEIDDLSSARWDVAIQYYYGSVATSLLELVEEVPESGDRVVRSGVDPDRLADSLLDAIEDVIGLTRKAMTTKQNVDLFGACSNMREVRTEGTEGVDLDDLLDWLGEDVLVHQRRLNNRIENVDDRIVTERGNVSTIAPVREQFDVLCDHVKSIRSGDEIERVVGMYVVTAYLDAIEGLFDRPELVDRLKQTVF